MIPSKKPVKKAFNSPSELTKNTLNAKETFEREF